VPEIAAVSYDITSILHGKPHETPLREATVHHSVSGQFAIRKGDWKLIEGSGNGDYPRDKDGRIAVKTRTPDLDPTERKDVSHEHPDIVKELLELLDRYRKSG